MNYRHRAIGRNQEFIHSLSKTLGHKFNGGLVITNKPDKIVRDLKLMCDIDAEYEEVLEGLKGIALTDPRRVVGYKPKVIGYKFKIKKKSYER